MKAKETIAWQAGNFVQYAEVEISITFGDKENVSVISTLDIGFWRCAIEFGARLFAEKFGFDNEELYRMIVSIDSLKTVPCDTSLCAVAYVVFHAIGRATGISGGDRFSFDMMRGTYAIGSLPFVTPQ